MAASKEQDVLTWVAARVALVKVAHLASQMEAGEFATFCDALTAELQSLRGGNATSELWRQAVEGSGIDGLASYGLERIGLWPPSLRQGRGQDQGH